MQLQLVPVRVEKIERRPLAFVLLPDGDARLLQLVRERFKIRFCDGKRVVGVVALLRRHILARLVGQWLSDKLGRRKVFIVVSALIFAAGTILLTQTTEPTMFFVAEAIIGVGFGAYVAVDLALVLDVLPDPEETAKDLGVFNIAMAGPQVVAPALAAWIVGLSSGTNYDIMLIIAGAIAVIGAVLIIPVRSVR